MTVTVAGYCKQMILAVRKASHDQPSIRVIHGHSHSLCGRGARTGLCTGLIQLAHGFAAKIRVGTPTFRSTMTQGKGG